MPRDLTVTLAADVPLEQVQKQLGEAGQWLAVDGDPKAPVGKLVQDNSTGPLRLGFGAWRDLLLGCQFTNGRGELITAGGRTMKNVAGYDLSKFMVGQRGVFGKIVTITARTYRRPAASLIAAFAAPTAEERVKRLSSLLPTDCRPQWALVNDEVLMCGYLADEPTLAYLGEALAAHRPMDVVRLTLEQDIQRRCEWLAAAWAGQEQDLRCRASLPPARLAAFIAQARPERWVADPAFGIVWASGGSDAQRLIAAAQASGGSALLFRADHSMVDRQESPQVQALLKRLKKGFDPEGALARLPIAET
jgi:glycolate oxidase FAD binding subunit